MERFLQVPFDKIAIELRDDVQLRTYVLLNRDRKLWNAFLQGANNYNIKPRSYEGFLDLYEDIKINGMQKPVKLTKIDNRFYIEDGAHRIAVLRALGKATIDAEIVTLQEAGHPSIFLFDKRPIDGLNYDDSNPRIEKIFSLIPSETKKSILEQKLKNDTEKIPMDAVAVIWSPAASFFGNIINDVSQFHSVYEVRTLATNSTEIMHSLILELYESDDVARWKVEKKFSFCDASGLGVGAIRFNIEDARHRIKRKTGNDISMEIEDLKSFLRKKYRSLIPSYPISGNPDIIVHAGDNEFQTNAILETLIKFGKMDKVHETVSVPVKN